MILLLTNDDGISSQGIATLREVLSREHEVWTVAPDAEKSGTSHGLTIKGAVRMRQLADRVYSCGGTPADCVLLSLSGAIPVKPDMIISGINMGPNLGTDIIYSGTAAAARQAALMGYSGVAVSLAADRPPYRFEAAAEFVLRRLQLFRKLWTPEHFLNINVPVSDGTRKLEAVVTQPSRRMYKDKLVSFDAPDGDTYYFLQGSLVESGLEEGSDWWAVSQGKISVSPIHLQPINHKDEDIYVEALLSGLERTNRE